jgi:hypothetical protein
MCYRSSVDQLKEKSRKYAKLMTDTEDIETVLSQANKPLAIVVTLGWFILEAES